MPEDKIPPGSKCCLMLQLVSIHDTVPEGPLMHGLTSSFKYTLLFIIFLLEIRPPEIKAF